MEKGAVYFGNMTYGQASKALKQARTNMKTSGYKRYSKHYPISFWLRPAKQDRTVLFHSDIHGKDLY